MINVKYVKITFPLIYPCDFMAFFPEIKFNLDVFIWKRDLLPTGSEASF